MDVLITEWALASCPCVKAKAKLERRRLARFKTHLQLVRLGRFTERGKLS
jgi:hypothetical protein